jgi:hypothetical protein
MLSDSHADASGPAIRVDDILMKYRLYIDEVGNSDLGSSQNINHRYLSLTGVILELGYVDKVLFPRLEALKRKYFGSHPDEPIILHRKELINSKPPFEVLRDDETKRTFDAELLELLKELEYTVITVVIDKLQHSQQYKVWRFDPYHYCLEVLVERYALWLKNRGASGDVMAESRGGKEDMRLKKSFRGVIDKGTGYVAPRDFTACLTSKELKVKLKANNIAGLQLADLIAHPSLIAALHRREGQPLPSNFGGRIAVILEDAKYYRSPGGRIDGWGRKWLP